MLGGGKIKSVLSYCSAKFYSEESTVFSEFPLKGKLHKEKGKTILANPVDTSDNSKTYDYSVL